MTFDLSTLAHRFMHTQSTRGQAARFLFVGGTSMIVDMATYRTVLYLSGNTEVGKAAGFIIGTTFAYFANRAFTFRDSSGGKEQLVGFLSVYLVTMFVNVGINKGMLDLLGQGEIGLDVSFAVATICSATLNFIGMKRFVFKRGSSPPTT